jgi:photosystem II stability/assembly factor-like uncharacterized protein
VERYTATDDSGRRNLPTDAVRERYGVLRFAVALAVIGVATSLALPIAKGATKLPALSRPADLIDVGCHAPSFCVIIGSDGSAASATQDSLLVARDGGREWEVTAAMPAIEVRGVACGSSRVCAIVGTSPLTSTGRALWTTDGGTTWKATSLPVDSPWSISCPSSTVCVVEGFNGSSTNEIIAVTVDQGASWRLQQVPNGLNGKVTCPSSVLCYFTGDENGGERAIVMADEDNNGNWELQKNTAPSRLGGVDGFACSTPERCVGLGAALTMTSPGGGILSFVSIATTDMGATWTEGTGPSLFGGFSETCLTSLLCIAGGIGDSGGGPLRIVVRTADGGATWSASVFPTSVPYAPYAGLACASPSLCVEIGSFADALIHPVHPPLGPILVSRDGGLSWSAATIE